MSNKTQNTSTSTSTENNAGAAILAMAGMMARSYGKPVQGRAVRCAIALEKAGDIRPIGERVETGLTLSKAAVARFNKLAKAGDEGAKQAVDLHKQLQERHKDIAAYKAEKASKEEAPATEAAE